MSLSVSVVSVSVSVSVSVFVCVSCVFSVSFYLSVSSSICCCKMEAVAKVIKIFADLSAEKITQQEARVQIIKIIVEMDTGKKQLEQKLAKLNVIFDNSFNDGYDYAMFLMKENET